MSSCLAFLINLSSDARKVPYRNFFRVYGTLSDRELKKMTYKYFRAFIDFFVEMAKMTSFSEKRIKQHCVFKNIELVERLAQEHRFILCFAGHMLNYEMTISFPLHTKDIGMCHLYLATKPSKGLDWMLKERSKYGAVNVPSNAPLKTILRLNKEIEEGKSKYKSYLFGSLSDLDPKMDDKHSAPFFGRMLEVKTGAEKLARKFNMGYCYAYIRQTKRGYYEIEFMEMHPQRDPAEYEYAYTDEFVRMFEQNINEQPELWMQWGACRF